MEQDFDEMQLLEATLSQRLTHKVRICSSVRGIRARWLEMMHNNAEQALNMRRLARAGIESSLEDLREAFDLEEAPNRLECFDISHTGGTDTVASCVVFGPEGPLKSDYRRFNINGIQPGDDYAAMYQALSRRYKRVRDGEIVKPDVLLIDGGKGQLAEAAKVLEELGIDGVTLIGVAKGVDRRAGQEQLFLLGQDTPTILPPDSRARRSASLRNRWTSQKARQAPQPVDSRNHSGLRTCEAARAAQAIRRPSRDTACRHR